MTRPASVSDWRLLAQKRLPRMMFDNIEQNLTPVIPAIAVLLTAISIFVLVSAAILRRMARSRSMPAEEA